MVSWVPTGTVSRSPDIRSAVATQTRTSPCLRNIPADQPVVLESNGESMGGGSGESGRRHQSGERGGSGLQCAEHESGFVQDADAARVVDALILPSRMLERKS